MKEDQKNRYEACFELYKKYAGRKFSQIERDMRSLGFVDFHRRILYSRKENGIRKPGWIEKYGWHGTGSNTTGSECAPQSVSSSESQAPSPSFSKLETWNPKLGTKSGTLPTGRVTAFQAWLKQVSPNYNWSWKYQRYIYRHLERITSGENKRLMIFLPPRHGKSELVTVRYAGWRLWNDPAMRVIVSSYNQKLADKFSRSIRKLLSEEEDRQARNTCVLTTPSARKKREHPPLLRQGGEKESQLPSLSKEGWQPDAFNPADGVVTNPPDIQAADIDARQRQSCDHPRCAGGTAAYPFSTPDGKAQPFRTSSGEAAGRMFPKTRTINTVSQWETAAGGGVKAVGVGAGVTGFGAQLVIIDDPVKSREQAESETFREKVWDWYRNDLYTRLEPNGAIILIQTRWHEDDLAGRLLKEMQSGGDQWEVVSLPALAEIESGKIFTTETQRHGEEKENTTRNVRTYPSDEAQQPSESLRLCASVVNNSSDPLDRPVGTALCPERYDEHALDEIRRQLGGYAFSALYQQRPTPAEGGIFKRAWFRRFVDRAPEGLKWKRGYDLAVSTKTTSCYTSSFRVAYDDAGNMYIADGFRERIEFPDQKRYIVSRLMSEKDTEHGIEKALHGEAIIQDLRRDPSIRGSVLRGVTVTADKLTRALKWAPLAEEGKVILVRGPWNQVFLDEICSFPGGQYDDQVDAVSLAVTMFENKGRRLVTF